jgi:hypothetical protein
LDSAKKQANLMIVGQDAEYFAKFLAPHGVDGDIFTSGDGRFAILVYFGGTSQVQSVQIIYRQ